MKKLTYSLAPQDWAICFQQDCPLADRCLRYAVARLVPHGLTCHNTVLPAAREGDGCRLFATSKPVRIARGMKGLFKGVKDNDASRMRAYLYCIFGSRPQYFRYRNGDYDITPEQQALVSQLFQKFGYHHEVPYDESVLQYYFPKP